MDVNESNKVSQAIKTTTSFIYGTSTLLGQEASLDYLLAVREYVDERIKAEAESWRPERDRKIEEYKQSVSKRAEQSQSQSQYKNTLVMPMPVLSLSPSPMRLGATVKVTDNRTRRDTGRLRKTM